MSSTDKIQSFVDMKTYNQLKNFLLFLPVKWLRHFSPFHRTVFALALYEDGSVGFLTQDFEGVAEEEMAIL